MRQALAAQPAASPVPHSRPSLGRGEEEAAVRVLRSGWLAPGAEAAAAAARLAELSGCAWRARPPGSAESRCRAGGGCGHRRASLRARASDFRNATIARARQSSAPLRSRLSFHPRVAGSADRKRATPRGCSYYRAITLDGDVRPGKSLRPASRHPLEPLTGTPVRGYLIRVLLLQLLKLREQCVVFRVRDFGIVIDVVEFLMTPNLFP